MSLFVDADPMRGFPAVEALDWASNPMVALADARQLLERETDPQSRLAAYLRGVDQNGTRQVTSLSAEKSTHYKWYLGGGQHYRVWLHQYRSAADFAKAESFAASIHNHRYLFASRVLSGSLQVRHFTLLADRRIELAIESVQRVGETAMLDHEQVHQVHAVADGTVTLVIQGPTLRSYSTVYRPDGSFAKDVYDLDYLFGQLQDALR